MALLEKIKRVPLAYWIAGAGAASLGADYFIEKDRSILSAIWRGVTHKPAPAPAPAPALPPPPATPPAPSAPPEPEQLVQFPQVLPRQPDYGVLQYEAAPFAAPSYAVPFAAPFAAPSYAVPFAAPFAAPSYAVPYAAPYAAPSYAAPYPAAYPVPYAAPYAVPGRYYPAFQPGYGSYYRGELRGWHGGRRPGLERPQQLERMERMERRRRRW